VTNVVNFVVTMAAMIKTTMTRTITMKIYGVAVLSVSHTSPGTAAAPLQTHIVESSDSPIEIPHRSLESELLSMNLDTSHVKLVPGRVTILVAVKDGKGHLCGFLVGEESSDITKQDDVVSFPPERVVQSSGERLGFVGRRESGSDSVIRRVRLQDRLTRDLGGDVSEGTESDWNKSCQRSLYLNATEALACFAHVVVV